MLQLLIIPLLVVCGVVVVFVGFGLVASERKDQQDYQAELSQPTLNRRWQAAFELARRLTGPDAEAERAEARRLLAGPTGYRALFQQEREPRVRRFLVLVLGSTQDPSVLPILEETARSDPDEETRYNAVAAAGLLATPEAAAAALPATGDPASEVRKVAAYTLGQLLGHAEEDPTRAEGKLRAAARERLEQILTDPVEDVRWNAAVALARLGSAAGAAEIDQMLDRQHLQGLPHREDPERPAFTREEDLEEVLLTGLTVAAALGEPRHLPLVRALAREDPSLRVRSAARQVLARTYREDSPAER